MSGFGSPSAKSPAGGYAFEQRSPRSAEQVRRAHSSEHSLGIRNVMKAHYCSQLLCSPSGFHHRVSRDRLWLSPLLHVAWRRWRPRWAAPPAQPQRRQLRLQQAPVCANKLLSHGMVTASLRSKFNLRSLSQAILSPSQAQQRIRLGRPVRNLRTPPVQGRRASTTRPVGSLKSAATHAAQRGYGRAHSISAGR